MNITLKRWQMLILTAIILVSFSVSVIIVSDFNKPAHYNLLFILPLIFGMYLLLYAKVLRKIFDNLGLTMILGLMFVRLVVSPFLNVLGGFPETIKLNVHSNTPISILLVAYETIAILTTLFLLESKESSKEGKHINGKNCAFYLNKKYTSLLFILIIIQIAICIYTPGLLEGYRSVFHINDKTFTHLEQVYINQKYGTSFATKLSLVTGAYLMKILRLLIPGVFIIWINKKKRNVYRKALSYIVVLTQFLIIDGAIARTIIYALILFLLINYIYPYKRIKKIARIFVTSSVVVLFFWMFTFRSSSYEMSQYFSARFNNYFSGVNIVSGSLNLPNDLWEKMQYFVYDYLKSVPYGNTIFSLGESDMGIYFNLNNGTTGQIPTTIGSGYFYFGFLFAPTYSIVFTILTHKMGRLANQTPYLISKIRYLFLAITFSMGIVMYNIQITLTSLISVGIPMYLIERLAYRKYKNLIYDNDELEYTK